jgi:endonuclease/exonuclease/phosphatase family metal-dependent hydrolase
MFTTDYASSFHVMTYNIRMDTAQDGVNRWDLRKDRVFRLIQQYQPDLIGVQEALPHQLADLHAAIPSFGWYGVGRDDGKNNGEFAAIFYSLSHFELRDKGTFWLSKTPDTPGSKGWDAALPRICSWVKLKDRRTNQKICHFNTHLDHVGKIARRESARLILSRIQQIAGPRTPTILTGDFNVGPESDPYRIITSNTPLQDAKQITKSPHHGPHGTWSTFDVRRSIGQRLDYIFVSSQHFKVLRHAHLTYSENMYYPSDHLPVLANLTLRRRTEAIPKYYFY